jgi:CBS domain-containing protein
MTTQLDTPGATALDRASVAEAMHAGVVTCSPGTPLGLVARMMASHRIHSVVVWGDAESDAEGVWGVVSDLDLIGVAASEDLAFRTAGGSARSPAVMIAHDESLRRAAQLMREHSTAHLVVVDRDSTHPVGVLSTLDIAAYLAGSRLPIERSFR